MYTGIYFFLDTVKLFSCFAIGLLVYTWDVSYQGLCIRAVTDFVTEKLKVISN